MQEFEFLEKLSFLLFESARWKVAFGGRGAGKTEGFALALLLLSRTKRLRILCARELQNSIDESVKFTIEAWINQLGIEDEFIITNKQIICKRTGSRFFFMGLRYNINKVKSLGRVDICWIEEADKTSKTTLDKLSPTIRGRSDFEKDRGGPFGVGPEIWVSFNPDLDTDEVYKRFVLERIKYAPEFVTDEITGEKVRYAIVTKINYWDNKWFPPDSRLEMNVMRQASEDKYLEVWEGNTKQVLEGAIYAEELRQVIKDQRRGSVRYDPSKPVYTFWDLGHSDKTAIWFIQRVGLEYNVINFYQNNLKKIGHYIEHMQSLGYVYGTAYQPHDADNETLASRSIASLTRAAGFKVIVVPRPAKKVLGINAVRTVLPLCNFDEENTSEGWQCLARYAYKVDEETGVFSREPEHDTPYSHGADAFQTFALSLKTEQDTKKAKTKEKVSLLPQRPNAWMGTL
jgi:phage terminase large subunit